MAAVLLQWQVLELQQQLKSVQHQLRVEEARTGQSVLLERDSRDLSDTLSVLRAKQQEEQITRSHTHLHSPLIICSRFCRDSGQTHCGFVLGLLSIFTTPS